MVMINIKGILCALLLAVTVCSCSGSSTTEGDNGSTLPDDPPKFTLSPMTFPNGANIDLKSMGIYNITSGCDVTHYGWDFIPYWPSYQDDRVPIIAVADGAISNIVPNSSNIYNNQEISVYVVMEAVSKGVEVHYTFEPFVLLGDNDSLAYLNVNVGDTVRAGDIIGYLPKLSGNLGEGLIHLDFKVGSSVNTGKYFCPTQYFNDTWRQENASILLSKIGSCSELCSE